MSETDLKRQIKAAIEACGYFVLRVNSGGYRGRMLGAPAGTPDLIGRFHDGARMWAVETKVSHGDKCKCAPCQAQRVWRAAHERDGGLYVLARSVDEALKGLGFGNLAGHEKGPVR